MELSHYLLLSKLGDASADVVRFVSSGLSSAFLVLVGTLLAWRWWSFTVRPSLSPNEPLELPYWIPCKCYEVTRKFNYVLTNSLRPRCHEIL